MATILLLISILSSLFPKLWGAIQVHQQQLVSRLSSCSTAFSALWQNLVICLPFRFLLSLLELTAGIAKSTRWHVLFSLLIKTRCGVLARIGWSIWISKSQRILSLISWNRFWFEHDRILFSCTILSRSPFAHNHVYFCIPFVSVCYIHLLYDLLSFYSLW